MGNGWCVSPRWQGPRDGKMDSKVNNLKKKKRNVVLKKFSTIVSNRRKINKCDFFLKERYFC